ncbi:hypothetical protein CORC01_03268 [Colletotrichum orchidophilum]|uniref:Uncharacterized protein n=1 Tax=Colletotrichum orchidophilum TaxID=1209926 RepID=A0A1G4BJ95_9PEZI|nr:uncharacterized protein CORC01_03268 [Colletotrichum orchidophilum]OHF01512.1 hypothetical protein CORC01_03268 [Colletotrichum orchidophilum]
MNSLNPEREKVLQKRSKRETTNGRYPIVSAGIRSVLASLVGPFRSSELSSEPKPTVKAKRHRDISAEPTRLSITGGQPDAATDVRGTSKGPVISTTTITRPAMGSVMSALDEEVRQYETRKDQTSS